MFVIVYSPFVVMDIIKSARNIMALPSVAVPATELQVLVSLSMIPITLLPQAISHGGREAGRFHILRY